MTVDINELAFWVVALKFERAGGLNGSGIPDIKNVYSYFSINQGWNWTTYKRTSHHYCFTTTFHAATGCWFFVTALGTSTFNLYFLRDGDSNETSLRNVVFNDHFKGIGCQSIGWEILRYDTRRQELSFNGLQTRLEGAIVNWIVNIARSCEPLPT